MWNLAHTYFLYGFLVIPLVVLVYLFSMIRRKKKIREFAETSLFKRLSGDSSVSKKNLKFILAMIAAVLIICGMVDPEIGSHLEKIDTKGSDIVIALDVSNSMNCQDISPSRLECAKQAIEKLIDKLTGDRIGIVLFAGKPFIQLPLTTDYGAAKMYLQTVNTSLIPVQGTAIGAAIDDATSLFTDDMNSSSGRSKSIILISDGENFEDDAVRAAAQAKEEAGIVIHTIAMGTEQGAPIPVFSNGQLSGFKKDKDGNTVITKLNIDLMQQIALETGGTCIRATSSDAGLSSVLNQINKMNKKTMSETRYRDWDEQFEYFIIPSLLLLLIDIFVTERTTKWYQRLNLFGTEKNK